MKLVACPDCHAQYDVTHVAADTFACRCGKTLENRALRAVAAEVHRCAACGAQVAEKARSCAYCGAAVLRDPGPLSLICPECFARNSESSRFCTACGVAFRPEPLPHADPGFSCPVCELPMKGSRIADVPLSECPECHGLWVPGERFEQLVQRASEARRVAGAATPTPRVQGGNPSARPLRYRKCPVCGAFMQRRNFRRSSGVILDVCRPHGTWLDADEIEEIAGFILSGGEPSPMLEEEHRRAESEAAAARLRCASELAAERFRAGHRGPNLLDLLRGILG